MLGFDLGQELVWRCPLAFGVSQIRRSCWDCWDASLLVVPCANSCCLVCHLPFGKPRKLLVGENLQTAVEKSCLASASQRNLLFFFPSLVSFPIEGEIFGDFTLSCKFGMDFVWWSIVKVIARLG